MCSCTAGPQEGEFHVPPTKAHFELHIPQAGLTRRPCDTALVWSTDYVSPVINIPIFLSLHSTHKQFFVFFSFFFKPAIRQEARLLSSMAVTCLTSQHSSDAEASAYPSDLTGVTRGMDQPLREVGGDTTGSSTCSGLPEGK